MASHIHPTLPEAAKRIRRKGPAPWWIAYTAPDGPREGEVIRLGLPTERDARAVQTYLHTIGCGDAVLSRGR